MFLTTKTFLNTKVVKTLSLVKTKERQRNYFVESNTFRTQNR